MRNRLRRQVPGEAAVTLRDNGDALQDAEQTSNENLTADISSGETEAEHVVRQALERTTTREEIVQTDDGTAFVQLPAEAAKRSWTQYRRIVFILGCIMGLLLAWVFRSPDLQLEGFLDSVDMADFFDDIKAALPAALPVGIVKEAKEIQKHTRESVGTGAFSVGEQMHRDGLSANFPVVMVFASTGIPYLKGPRGHFHWPRELVYDELFVLLLMKRVLIS